MIGLTALLTLDAHEPAPALAARLEALGWLRTRAPVPVQYVALVCQGTTRAQLLAELPELPLATLALVRVP